MFGTRWRLFNLFGIPLYVDASWVLVVALVTLTLTQQFHAARPDLPSADVWAMSLVSALSFFACIVLHELGHAVVARSHGMPIRGITLFLFGGVADLGAEPPSARSEFVTAACGPLVSAGLVGIFRVAADAGPPAGWPAQVYLVLAYLAGINLLVLVFNLVPAFPLDGGRILRSFLWGVSGRLTRATRWASWLGQAFAWALIGFGVLGFFTGAWVSGLWMVLIGTFLNGAAQSGYRQALIRQALRGEPVSRFMNREPVVVPPDVDLRHWVEDYVYRHHRKGYPVGANGHVQGVINTQDLARFPQQEWERHTVAEAMQPSTAALCVSPDADALEALERMQRSGSSRLLVTEGDRLVGLLTLKDLLKFLDLKLHLEPAGR